ncbi:endonuclease [Shewanella schlegeliana]|uniref:Endonuclease/exonuclease/phosphatase family protein n=1 Tax=Shewanella schlegeliana TaxID=190308 RepID=A0ABS1SV42_9GAMM|nr:endonuclease/exonuclease/phosphatase family protein [Shewanella schlegeliana]MBL4912393.1 endonuclease/exonuclease/phosphatase family protein [Shewanella schlegeliana]GIU21941.1 endonuclease [Shewanella schlegeliana]
MQDEAFTLKLASFNLFNYIEPPLAYYDFENIYTQEQWHKKQRWLADFLVQHQPDVIGFQEVFSADALAKQMSEVGFEYFAVVDTPTVIDDYICRDPVVGLASKYVFEEVISIEVDSRLAVGIGLDKDFAYSRKPLRATVKLPEIGLCDIYVVHFKSKRPHMDELPAANTLSTSANAKPLVNFGELLGRNSLGQWASSIQRGSEAALLFHTMLQRRIETEQPMILMGDFNDELSSSVLSALTARELRFEKEGLGELAHYPLTDAYSLFRQGVESLFLSEVNLKSVSEQDNQQSNGLGLPEGLVSEGLIAESMDRVSRAPTHYYGATGSVLDYILLSADFDPSYHKSIAEVCDYYTEDRHLVNPSFERDSQSSDHAPVICTIRSRS